MAETTIVITCMDKRYGTDEGVVVPGEGMKAERFTDFLRGVLVGGEGKHYLLRNAGANVRPFLKDIREIVQGSPGHVRVVVITHEGGCGGVGTALEVHNKDSAVANLGLETWELQFEGQINSHNGDRAAIEKDNAKEQVNTLSSDLAEFGDKVSIEGYTFTPAPKAEGAAHDSKHYLVITTPDAVEGMMPEEISERLGTDPKETYYVIANSDASFRASQNDTTISVRRMGIKDVRSLGSNATLKNFMDGEFMREFKANYGVTVTPQTLHGKDKSIR